MGTLTLLTTLSSQDTDSVLSLVADHRAGHVFGGSQLGDIHVWSLHTFFPITRLVGHQSSVLSLSISVDRSLLFSSSGDNTIRIWDSTRFGNSLYVIKPSIDRCGDVLSLAWCDRLNTLYLGCQDASIQWISLPPSKFTLTTTEQQACIRIDDSPKGNPTTLLSPDLCPPPPTSSDYRPQLPRSPPTASTSEPSSTRPASPHLSNLISRSAHHKFFDSLSQAELLKAARRRDSPLPESPKLSNNSNLLQQSPNLTANLNRQKSKEGTIEVLYIQDADCVTYAHFGYIYCLLLVHLNGHPYLISGSGDSTIKIWSINRQSGALSPPAKLLTTTTSTTIATNPQSADPLALPTELGAVLTMAVQGSTLYSGYQDGLIKIWDLDTFTCIRTLFHRTRSLLPSAADDILTMTVLDNGEMFSGCAAGALVKWDASFERALKWTAHQGSALASCFTFHNGKRLLLTGGSDNCIKVWDVYPEEQADWPMPDPNSKSSPARIAFQGRMLRHLSQFVSFRSVSNELHREDCRQAALYLKKTLIRLGADARLLAGEAGRNPLVLATFTGKSSSAHPNSINSQPHRRRKRVLYYGHYDVVQSGDTKDWITPPFVMTGQNGWLYGRGVSDNKGPTLAVACAVTTLVDQKSLDVDVVMLVEGEEEAGSAGFQRAVLENKELIGDIDVVLVSNSYWLGDDAPCMTFGLRGVIHATVKVTSLQPDLHSGMQGGAVHEPVLDLVRILSLLVDESGKIRLDGFYDGVRPMDSEEEKLYDAIIEHLNGFESATLLKHSHFTDTRAHLLAKWRQPTLSIHKVDVTGPAHSTVIPSSAQAAVSIRIVPDQSLQEISSSLINFLEAAFAQLKSSNKLEVSINHTADWWLGDLNGPYVRAIGDSIKAEWGTEPLWIREGGSIPGIPFLEQEFKVKAIHLPMGAASDSAHLPNERIKMVNLEKGKNVVARFLMAVAKIGEQEKIEEESKRIAEEVQH
ncbi:hypothetical protein CROQUDRAFT_659306 [Cronartium quercuum f. sp. fusiforme G11]|uniref:Peptidase M20 dimerisation domain-containing protein n=1 Tax=Cronartium quercuum f. sp. fusiforme G11 TaxID=708437 RepID=A0A9P6NK32_9BASI|nr:hypothetical protein CROQUDRAFT_659306 [Cronartium quercuum f. sp. fusiforme G11]